jgi:K+-sensing histidine kinase KdpD
MRLLKAALPIAVTLAIISIATAVLWTVRIAAVGPQHLVFFYLLPTALLAVLYGSLPAMLGAVAATICAAYFLYIPLYSFSVENPRELGELFFFHGRPIAAPGREIPEGKSRDGRLIPAVGLAHQNCDAS